MSRRKTRPEDIRNPEHYFNRYVALEVKHDQIRQGEIEDLEVSFEDHFEGDTLTQDNAVNAYGDMDELSACADGSFAWIDYLDTPALFEAVSAFTDRQKQILTLFAMQRMTTREIADKMGVSHVAIVQNIGTIRKKLEKVLGHPYQKP